jgi:hypothetical protein
MKLSYAIVMIRPHVVLYAIICLILTHLKVVQPYVRFAYYQDELYANIHGQIWDRGYQTLWGLLQLQFYARDQQKKLSNIFSTIENIQSDQHLGKEIAFWRSPDDTKTILWPEHDYFGWQATWQAPYPLFIKALQSPIEHVSWKRKKNQVYWSGTLFDELKSSNHQSVRHQYKACSETNPDIVVDSIDWASLKEIRRTGVFQSGNDTKPIYLDNRKKLQYKFAIYMPGLQWSSALKRIIASGSVLVMPIPNPHHSYVSQMLDNFCKDCYITIAWTPDTAPQTFCESLTSIVKEAANPVHDDQYLLMANRLRKFSMEVLDLSSTLEYMYSTLETLADSKRKLSDDYDQDVIREMKRNKLYHFNCSSLRKFHLFEKLHEHDLRPPKIVGLRWQYDEWYDHECRMREDAEYLSFTAI